MSNQVSHEFNDERTWMRIQLSGEKEPSDPQPQKISTKMIKAVRLCKSYLTNLCLMKEDINPSLQGWVAGLLNSAAVVLWRHLGNAGNWWTYPVTLESQLIWAPLCSSVRRPQAGGRAVSRDFHDFLHALRCTYMNTWTLVCLAEKVRLY